MRYFNVFHDLPRGIYVYHELRLARGMVSVIDRALALYHRAMAFATRAKVVPQKVQPVAPLHAPLAFHLPDEAWRASMEARESKPGKRVVLTPSGRGVVVDGDASLAWMYVAEEAADRLDSVPGNRTLH